MVLFNKGIRTISFYRNSLIVIFLFVLRLYPPKQVCNDVMDCLDGSDECLCQNHVHVKLNNQTIYCVSQKTYCELSLNTTIYQIRPQVDCSAPDLKAKAVSHSNPIELCMIEYFEMLFLLFDVQLVDLCEKNCSSFFTHEDHWPKFCKLLTQNEHGFPELSCERKKGVHRPGIETLCDGKVDCVSGADEEGCPGRFYCFNNSESLSTEVTNKIMWVPAHKKCDQVKDCPNSMDECNLDCDLHNIASPKSLIKSYALSCLNVIFGLAVLVINAMNGYKAMKSTTSSLIAKTDRLLCIQIFVYDFIMGIYLCFIVVASVVLRYKGDYCVLSDWWRSSVYCDILGVIFSFSTHGSLLIVSLMSIVRSIQCTVSFIRIPYKAIISLSCIICLLNMIHAVIPAVKLPQIEHIFKSDIFLVNIAKNPLLNSFDEQHIADVYHTFIPNQTTEYIVTMLDELKQITSIPDIFDFTVIGYYGTTPICIQNIFREQESYRAYKIGYCTVISVLLAVVSVSYIVIVVKQNKSAAIVQNNQGDHQQNKDLLIKVSLMIRSQLLSWVSLMITANYFFGANGSSAPEYVFEIFALFVMPINSLLNPIFYSGMYKIAFSFIKQKGLNIISAINKRLDPPDQPEEFEMENINPT